MRVRVLVVIVVGVVAVIGGVAHAKGPSAAELTGEGIATPIDVDIRYGTGSLIEEVGLFAAADEVLRRTLDAAPPGALGPRFTLAWHLPGPGGATDVVTQYLYPYADAGPLVHTAPGQTTFYGSELARGGWYRAQAQLVTELQALGVPAREVLEKDARAAVAASGPVRNQGTNDADLPLRPIGASLGLVVIAAAALVLILRRRRTLVPTTT